MYAKVNEVRLAGYLGEDGAHAITTLFLEEKELFALLAGYPFETRIAIGGNIWVDIKAQKEEIK